MFIRDFLQSRSVRFEVLLHAPSQSATHLAGTIHVPGRLVAKSVLFEADGVYSLAVLPATHRIDVTRLAAVVRADHLRIAIEEDVERIFENCEPGALPPFGELYGLRTILEASLSSSSEIVFVGNTRHEGFRMRYKDYERLVAPTKARFASPIHVRRPRNQKKAG